jgi:DNA polymerase-3 subunit alpha
VTIKRFRPLEALAKSTRLQMVVRAPDRPSIEQVVRELTAVRGGSGKVEFVVPLESGGTATVLAGRDFTLDAELAARIESITGEGSVELSTQEPKLALVG